MNKTAAVAAHLSPGAIVAPRISGRWSNDEYQLAIKGIQKHGKDFQAIAEILGTKTEQQVSQFYTSNRKKYNLDEKIKEFEAKQQQQQQQQKQKLNEAQPKSAISSSSATNDTKADIKKHISDDDIMEVSKISIRSRLTYTDNQIENRVARPSKFTCASAFISSSCLRWNNFV